MSGTLIGETVRTVRDAFDAGVRAARCAKELGDLSVSRSVATTDALKRWADTLNETDQRLEPAGNTARASILNVVEVHWDVSTWLHSEDIPAGWEPFAFNTFAGAIICRKQRKS